MLTNQAYFYLWLSALWFDYIQAQAESKSFALNCFEYNTGLVRETRLIVQRQMKKSLTNDALLICECRLAKQDISILCFLHLSQLFCYIARCKELIGDN